MSSSNPISTPISTPRKKPLNPAPNVQSPLLSSKTPDKTADRPLRARNRGVALSIREVRKAAESLRGSPKQRPRRTPSGNAKKARRQILLPQSSTQESKNTTDVAAKLPEKYEMLAEIFDGLHNSIRLLRLRSSRVTFTNICATIKCLTNRRFTYGHLAQMKYLLREAMEIKKILSFDEQTSCMRPDLHVSLNTDAMENDGNSKSERGDMQLRKEFRTRLSEFFKSHPNGDDIPEEILPEPFNHLEQKQQSNLTEASPSLLPCETSADVLANHQAASASHLSPSFRKCFSKKISGEAEDRPLDLSKFSSQPTVSPPAKPFHNEISTNKESVPSYASSAISLNTATNEDSSVDCSVTCHPPASPSKESDAVKAEDLSPMKPNSIPSTPAKLISTPNRLMTVTPSMNPPKRCYMSPGDDPASQPDKLVRRPTRSRSLKFDSLKNEETRDEISDLGENSSRDDILDILPPNLRQSIREKEKKAMEESDPAISQAKRRKQMISKLPKLFNTIRSLFQSSNRSVITKEELVQKIIVGRPDIDDRSELEEQLKLLLELVPEWISEKVTSSGDLVVRVNTMSTTEAVRARLEEAK